MTEAEYDEAVNNPRRIAKTIWDNPFLSGLHELNQAQLIIIIQALVEKLDYLENGKGMDERDWKDIAFDKKCLIIETVDETFFKRKEK